MPNVNNLFKRNVPTAPAAVQNPQTTPVQSPQSQPMQPIVTHSAPALIESKGSIGILPNLPAWLQQSAMPEVAVAEFGALVGFGSSDAKSWEQQKAAGIREGQPFVKNGQTFVPLESLQFYVLRGESYQSMMYSSEGKFLFATKDLSVTIPDRIHMGNVVKCEPHYVVSMVAVVNGQHVPCRADFRGTKAGGAEGPINAVKAAQSPDWAKNGDAHRITLSFPQAFGRVIHTVTTRRDTSKTSGNSYYRCLAMSMPSTVSQMQALVNAFHDKSFNDELEVSNKWYEERVKLMDNLCKNGPVA